MGINELIPANLLPHKAPMLLIDRVIDSDFESKITVESDIRGDAFFMQGHFPDYPLLPGVVILEMMFQTCGILCRISAKGFNNDDKAKRIGRAVKVKSATFLKEVFPDSVLQLTADKISNLLNFSEFKISASVNGQKVCIAELIIAV
jgi:3-hydroxyacyl-[acyl-carrier-protein] dehydratase